jgi:hypothetical protein
VRGRRWLTTVAGRARTWESSQVSRKLETLENASHTHRTALYARGRNATVIAAYVAATAEPDRPEWIVLRDGAETFFDGSLQLINFTQLDEIESYWQGQRGTATPHHRTLGPRRRFI